MRRPTKQLVIAAIVSLLFSYPLSWGLMIALGAEFRFYGLGTLTLVAVLFALLIIFILDRPLNLRAFDWPQPGEESKGIK